ncbi:MAG: G5 domain-containing protein [Bifidobacteriaceae bacterium]|nr:G5 domain-containing protein [Bifidobacteriaceae bacterium]
MANHRKAKLSMIHRAKQHGLKIGAVATTFGVLVTAGLVSHSIYGSEHKVKQVSAYSITDDAQEVSRGTSRSQLQGNTSFIKVYINGKARTVFGTDFTTVKSVLETGDITLEPNDTVTPSLTTKVNESTVIRIERSGATLETTDEPITFNTVYKKTSSLAKGTQKVETEGKNGVMETTSIVTRSGNTVVSSNIFASYVKTAPVDKVILVGTGSSTSSSTSTSSSLGTTVASGEMQQWAHDYLISNGYTEADFSALVYIISRESGWRVNATNASSGAYGLPQALPGSKMASAGADWATNYQTQIKWFISYCNGRYGSITGAYNHWVSKHWY